MKLKSIATKHSEASLFRTATLERYLKEILKEEVLSADVERELIKAAKSGDLEARNQLTKANLKFVVSVAKEHQRRGVELLDLINAGNLGLIEAIEKYDLEKDVKFISCAVWWIRARIIEFVRETGFIVPLPLNRQNEILKAERLKEKIYVQTGQNLPLEAVIEMFPEIKKSYIEGSVCCTLDPISIDESDTNNEDFCLAQSLPDNSSLDLQYGNKENKALLLGTIKKLPQIQSQIIELSFGLSDGVSYTPEEISRKMQISLESIKKNHKQALISLKESKILLNLYQSSN